MMCPNGCSATMNTVYIERIFYRNHEPIVIRDLKMYICPECGCEAMPLSSARAVERVLNGQIEPAGQFSAPLIQLGTPASA